MKKRRSLGWKTLGKEVWSEGERFWVVKSQQESREIEKNEPEIAQILYIKHVKTRQIERCWGLNFDRCIYRATIQRCPQQIKARWIEELSSIYRGDRNFLDGSRSYRDYDKKKLKSSIDSLVVERYRGAVDIA